MRGDLSSRYQANHQHRLSVCGRVCARKAFGGFDSFCSRTFPVMFRALTGLRSCVSLCVNLDFCPRKTCHSLVLYYCDYRHYDLCWRQAIQHSMVGNLKLWQRFFGTGSQGGNYWEEAWPFQFSSSVFIGMNVFIHQVLVPPLQFGSGSVVNSNSAI